MAKNNGNATWEPLQATAFETGQRVRAKVSAQGMHEDETYTVVDVERNDTPFGTFVTYMLTDEVGNRLAVTNGHLLLEAVQS